MACLRKTPSSCDSPPLPRHWWQVWPSATSCLGATSALSSTTLTSVFILVFFVLVCFLHFTLSICLKLFLTLYYHILLSSLFGKRNRASFYPKLTISYIIILVIILIRWIPTIRINLSGQRFYDFMETNIFKGMSTDHKIRFLLYGLATLGKTTSKYVNLLQSLYLTCPWWPWALRFA